jgi:two-component system, NarL family, sensor kinase
MHKQKIAAQEKQFTIMSNLLKGQEKERSRLAKDLHDGIGSILTSVKYSLASAKRDFAPENEESLKVLENSIEVIDLSINELRRVAYNMMPEALIKFGLDEGLKDFCQFIKSANGLHIHYQSFGLHDRLDNDIEIVLYRIVQELLTNVVKHSSATETYVQLVRDGSRLSISVEDNGKGFSVDKLSKKKSTGWLSLQSRVNYLKGKLEINSILEKGTTVAIEFHV